MEIGLLAPAVCLCLPVGLGAADSLTHTGKEEGVQVRHTDSAAPCHQLQVRGGLWTLQL